MPGPYAVRVKTVDGWQDIALLGPAGPTGATGPTGAGVPVGGTTGQVLAKKSATDFDTEWAAGAGSWKQPVKAVSTSSIYNMTGSMTIDDVPLVTGDRVLVTAQSLPRDNGIYIVASIAAWTRAPDADTWNELATAAVFVEQGTVNADSGWVCTANQGGTLGTTAVTWTKFTGSGSGSGAGGHTIQDEGVSLTARTKLNFIGAGVTAVDDSTNDRTLVTVPGTAIIAGRWSLGSSGTLIPANGALTIAIGAADGYNTAGWVVDATGVTVPEAGWYQVNVSGQVNNGATAGGGFLSPTYNGGTSGEQLGGTWAVNGVERFSETQTVYLVAGTKVGATIFSYVAGATWYGTSLAISKVNGAKGDTGATGGNATVPMDTVHLVGAAGEPAFQNGWSSYGGGYSAPGFRKDPLGKVLLRGSLKGGTLGGAVMFALPVGYRPTANQRFNGQGGSQSAATWQQINIYAQTGELWVWGDSNGIISLDGIEFDTETVTAMPTGPQGAKGDPGGTIGACTFRQTASVSPGPSSGWRTLWVGSSNVIDPVGSFTRNSDGTVTITDAGWYSVSASILNGTAAAVTLALTDTLNALGTYFAVESDSVPAGYYKSIAADNYFAAGAKIYVNAWSDVSTVVSITAFQIARIGGPKGDKGADGVAATVLMDTWHVVGSAGEPAFGSAGWAANAPGLRFRKDPLGRVWIDGTAGVSGGANGSTLFTLPAGYRPKQGITSDNLQTNGAAGTWVGISSAGVVTPSFASGSAVYIDVSFDTETVTAMPTGPQGPAGPVGGNATVAMDTWHTVGAASEPAFAGSWAAYGGGYQVPQFRKDPLGKVWIRGLVKAGAVSTTMFTLPVGYRPPAETGWYPAANSGAAAADGEVRAQTDGQVKLLAANVSAGYAWIDGQFDTDTVTAMPTGPQGPQGVAGPSTPIPLVTSLPAAPVDGQEVYFQSATMAVDGIVWHLRYRAASSSAYKWEVVGGRDLFAWTNVNVAYTTGGAYVVGPALAAPQLTYPLAGDYILTASVNLQANTTVNAGDLRLQIFINGGVVNYGAMSGYSSSIVGANMIEPIKVAGQVAGQVVDMRLMSSLAATNMSIYDRSLRMEPIRVG